MDGMKMRAWMAPEVSGEAEGRWVEVELDEKAVRRLAADPDLRPELRICAEAYLAAVEG